MSWQCKILEIVGTREVRWAPPEGGGKCGETQLLDAAGVGHAYDDLPPGTMFYVPESPIVECGHDGDRWGWPWYWAKDDWLSDYYRQNNAGRRPLFVILPGRHLFLIDGKCWSDGKAYGGWGVTGEAPTITVTPSINIGGSYHGWLQGGVISDDCEGRRFGQDGKIIK